SSWLGDLDNTASRPFVTVGRRAFGTRREISEDLFELCTELLVSVVDRTFCGSPAAIGPAPSQHLHGLSENLTLLQTFTVVLGLLSVPIEERSAHGQGAKGGPLHHLPHVSHLPAECLDGFIQLLFRKPSAHLEIVQPAPLAPWFPGPLRS